MSLGFPIDKPSIDVKAAQLVVNVRNALADADTFCRLLQNTNIFPADNSNLTALGYTGPEITTLRAAFTDLQALFQVAHGTRTQPGANDFFFNAQHLTGVV